MDNGISDGTNMTGAITREQLAAILFRYAKQKGYDVDLAKLQADIAARDKADSEREISPLVKAEDAVLLDTTGMGIQEVTAAILDMCR